MYENVGVKTLYIYCGLKTEKSWDLSKTNYSN